MPISRVFLLNQFIDHFIYYDGYNSSHSIDRFLPDGNTEIIIDFDDRPRHIYDNQTLKEIQAFHRASGVRTEFITISPHLLSSGYGFMFTPSQ
jgi:uncharacterized protein DUF6597